MSKKREFLGFVMFYESGFFGEWFIIFSVTKLVNHLGIVEQYITI